MEIKEAHVFCFSPANHTMQVCQHIMEKVECPGILHDLTAHGNTCDTTLSNKELAIFAVPSFGGRVPAIALEKFKNIHGNQTPCILVVTFGNRAQEDTLIELKDFVCEHGFITVGAMAVVCEHSIMHQFGVNRPDIEDMKKIDAYLSNIQTALKQDQIKEVHVSGNHPYKEFHAIPMVPKANSSCIACGKCAIECPVKAIDPMCPSNTDKSKCISCMRCITICPTHARALNPVILKGAVLKLKKACESRKEIELY